MDSRMDEGRLRDLYQQLISINHEAFVGGEYDLAYHALSGALHCGQALNNVEYLVNVRQTAEQQLTWIDAHDPACQHSTLSAVKRGHNSIYRNLSAMAAGRAQISQMKPEQQRRD